MKSIALKKAIIITAVLIITAASVFAHGGHNGNHGGNHNGSGHNSGCYTDGNINHDGTQHHSGNYPYGQPSGTVQPADITENKADSTATR